MSDQHTSVTPNLYVDKVCEFLNEKLKSHRDYIKGSVEFLGGVRNGSIIIGHCLIETTTYEEDIEQMLSLMAKIESENLAEINKILSTP